MKSYTRMRTMIKVAMRIATMIAKTAARIRKTGIKIGANRIRIVSRMNIGRRL